MQFEINKNETSVTESINNAHLSNKSTLGSNVLGDHLGDPITPNINFSSAYAFSNFSDLKKYHNNKLKNHRYSRDSSEITSQVEHYFSIMHNNAKSFLFRTGMSAIMASIYILLNEVDTIITFGIFYRKTQSILDSFKENKLIRVINVNSVHDINKIENFVPKKTLFFIENPSNPFLKLVDLEILKKNNPKSLFILDFTLSGLLNHKFLNLADIAVTSCTKYVSGHNDLLGGLCVVNNKKYIERIWQYRSMSGSLCDPLSSYLLLRSLRTYDVRLEKMLKNKDLVIQFLSNHPKVESLFYPGQFNNKNNSRESQKLLNHGGSLITFETSDDVDLKKNIEKLRSIKMAPTFGSIDSIIEIPLFMSRGMEYDPSKDYGGFFENLLMSKNLARLSIGCEPFEFLLSDLKILFS